MPILSDGTVVRVKIPSQKPTKLIRVNTKSVRVLKLGKCRTKAVVVRGPQGLQGFDGASGNFGFERIFSAPSASWIIPVPPYFGRTPSVAVVVEGRSVIADVTADSSTVTVQHPEPTIGSVILT